MKGVIYRYTFPDGKVYIGQTRRPLEIRHKEHVSASSGVCNPRLWAELEKFKEYKLETIETIEKDTTLELVNELNRLETFYIGKYQATNPKYGLNEMARGTSPCPEKLLLDDEFREIWTHVAEKIYPSFCFIYDKIVSGRGDTLNEEEKKFIHNNLLNNNIFSDSLRDWLDSDSFTIIGENEEEKENGEFWLGEALDFAESIITDKWWELIDEYISKNKISIVKKRRPNSIYQQYDLDGNLIKEYRSKEEVLQVFKGKHIENIINAAKGKQKTAYKYKWKIVDK